MCCLDIWPQITLVCTAKDYEKKDESLLEELCEGKSRHAADQTVVATLKKRLYVSIRELRCEWLSYYMINLIKLLQVALKQGMLKNRKAAALYIGWRHRQYQRTI